jgi:hypothetical protein
MAYVTIEIEAGEVVVVACHAQYVIEDDPDEEDEDDPPVTLKAVGQ